MQEEFEDTKEAIKNRIYIEEEQTTQWPTEKVQKDKQRSTNHLHYYRFCFKMPYFRAVLNVKINHIFNAYRRIISDHTTWGRPG